MNWDTDTIKLILAKPLAHTQGYPNSKIIYKMLQALFERQTEDEQSVGVTKHNNAQGFNAFDAQFLTDVALTSRQYKNLTPGQSTAVAKCLIKYIGQLVDIAAHNQQMKLTKSVVSYSEQKKQFFAGTHE